MSRNSPGGLLSLRPPDGTRIAVMSDVHIGIHDEPAIRTLIECFEREGVTWAIANGDIHDCAAVSPHKGKARRAVATSGQLAEEAASGRWIIDWLQTRAETFIGEGNHEDWINDLALETNTVGTTTVTSMLGLPEGPHFHTLPHGYQIRIGSLVLEHGDLIPGGGQHKAANILRRFPNQTTIVGHHHIDDYSILSHPDQSGVQCSHAVHCLGHLSLPEAHSEYAGRMPAWQQGGGIVTIWYDDGKPRFTVDHILIHRDRRNRPVFEYRGHVYR